MDVAHVYGGASAADASDSDDGDTSDGLEDAAGAPVGRRPGDRARHINPQLMQVWVYQRDALGWSAEYIAEVNRTFDNIICAKTVRRALKRWDDTGLVDYPPRKARQVAVGPDERKVLKDIINAEPYLYLSEIAAEFNFRMGTHLSREHIHGALIKANLSLKKGQERRRARCEELRAVLAVHLPGGSRPELACLRRRDLPRRARAPSEAGLERARQAGRHHRSLSPRDAHLHPRRVHV